MLNLNIHCFARLDPSEGILILQNSGSWRNFQASLLAELGHRKKRGQDVGEKQMMMIACAASVMHVKQMPGLPLVPISLALAA